MVISAKDGLKLVSISIVCFCAVFVCTFMLNFYLDASALECVSEAQKPLYDAQLAMAQMTASISGGFLALIAVVMLVFYIRLYVQNHSLQLGIIKAMGYGSGRISIKFWVFGLSVLLGCTLGFAAGWIFMPKLYDNMTIEGLNISVSFHPLLFIFLVPVPAAVFSVLSCAFAYAFLRRPVMQLIRGKSPKFKRRRSEKLKSVKERSFLYEIFFKSVSSKKFLTFFVAFAAFCFSAMVQMAMPMKDLSSELMGVIILMIGLALSITAMIMSLTALTNANRDSVTLMKAFGYNLKEYAFAVFGGFVPFALLGFAVGTIYQHVLLSVMVNIIFKDVEGVSIAYSFSIKYFFITLASFMVFYVAVSAYYILKLSRLSVKQAMLE